MTEVVLRGDAAATAAALAAALDAAGAVGGAAASSRREWVLALQAKVVAARAKLAARLERVVHPLDYRLSALSVCAVVAVVEGEGLGWGGNSISCSSSAILPSQSLLPMSLLLRCQHCPGRGASGAGGIASTSDRCQRGR